jgi:hypothetical protein
VATRRPSTGVLVSLLLAGLVASVATAVVGFVLADIYRPQASGGFVTRAPEQVRRSVRWSDRHLWAGVASVVLSAVAAGAAAWRRSLLALACAVVAGSMGLVTLFTRELVAWDQLALESVTVGSDVTGYWTAAFGEDVLFVLVGGSEASQAAYGVILLVHLGAPVTGAAVLLTAAVTVLRARPGDRGATPVETHAGTAVA